MVSSLAPKAMSSGRLKSRNTTVSTRLADTAPVTQLPRIFSAPARSPLAQENGGPGSPTHGREGCKSRDDHNEAHAHPHPGESRPPHHRDVTNINPVHHVIQGVHQLSGDGRQGPAAAAAFPTLPWPKSSFFPWFIATPSSNLESLPKPPPEPRSDGRCSGRPYPQMPDNPWSPSHPPCRKWLGQSPPAVGSGRRHGLWRPLHLHTDAAAGI